MKHLKRAFAGAASTLLAMSSAVFGANSAAPAGSERDIQQIVQSGTIQICSTGDYLPFTHLDLQGNWSGLDIDMAQTLSQDLGVRLDLVQTTWATLMQDLGAKCDMAVGGITITPDRAQQALFSAPLLEDGKAAIVRCEDASQYTSLATIDQPGVRVVVNPGGTNYDFDRANIKQAQILVYPDNNTIFEQLTNDQADVMITDASEIRYQTKNNPRLCGGGDTVDHPFTSEQKAYLIPQGNQGLQQRVNQWLARAENDGTYAKISEKWTGSALTP
ncbi:transporter substrate-binding domain-containing protein [Rhodococcus spongiicola]|uniref:Cyclohexadienyl dehydratase n=1 Tax=Rhodococcus spongiicola TaxID=2487352 RepID=A0A3S3B5F5_9NOCA|nr:transporter substrate-binding domain-containing protein [Rhodococcus spongiicola]RVW03623.1 cyclohexadienyl dehydratase [Rhodococcus spongiicola]